MQIGGGKIHQKCSDTDSGRTGSVFDITHDITVHGGFHVAEQVQRAVRRIDKYDRAVEEGGCRSFASLLHHRIRFVC